LYGTKADGASTEIVVWETRKIQPFPNDAWLFRQLVEQNASLWQIEFHSWYIRDSSWYIEDR
jgi:hypothetical protein